MAEFLVEYNYGTGGVWGFATAASEELVERLSPELKIMHEKPAWMTNEVEVRTRAVSSFAAGDEASYPEWVQLLIGLR